MHCAAREACFATQATGYELEQAVELFFAGGGDANEQGQSERLAHELASEDRPGVADLATYAARRGT